jgi:hypothetical protein
MSCPDQETLEGLAESGPFGHDARTLAHVKACEACQEELGMLRAERRAFVRRSAPLALPSFESLKVRPLPAFRSATWGSAPHTWTAGLATLAAAAAALVLHVKTLPRPSSNHELQEVGTLACYPPEDAAGLSSLRSPLATGEPSWAACLLSSPDSNLACETAQALVCDAESSL